MADATQIVNNQVGFAPEVAPYAQTLLGQAQAFANPNIPYEAYTGDRQAQFTPLQKQSFEGAQQMQPAYQLQGATGLAGLAGQQALNTQYTPLNYQSQSITGGGMGGNTNAYGGFGGPAVMPQQGGFGPGVNNFGGPQVQQPPMGSMPMGNILSPYNDLPYQGMSNEEFYKLPGNFDSSSMSPEQLRAATIGFPTGDMFPMGDTGGNDALQAAMQKNNDALVASNRPDTYSDYGSDYLPRPNEAPQNTLDQYMSPYVQQVIQRQQNDAARQAAIAGQAQQAQAARAGAFGGSGDYLMRAQAAGNLARQKGDIYATGMQNAYTQALSQFNQEQQQRQQAAQLNEQSRQYGAGLGLQGLQTAMTGANTLNTIGQNQFAQGMDINKLQNTYGTQQQNQMNTILGNQYQDWLNAQNQPYKQMGFMSDIIRGAPLSQMGSTMYQAPASPIAQVAGVGLAAKGLGMFAEGGAVEDVDYREKPAGLADLAIYNMG